MRRVTLLLAFVGILAGAAWAAPGDTFGFRGWGPRIGLSAGPDQAVFGAHIDFGSFADHFRLQPNIEVGLGDNRMLIALNGEFAYRFVADWDRWSPYLGGGMGLNISSDDRIQGHEQTSSDLGVNAMGGIGKNLMNGDRFFLEAKLGLIDSPDFKFQIGWTFF
jgi:hypothetical protein